MTVKDAMADKKRWLKYSTQNSENNSSIKWKQVNLQGDKKEKWKYISKMTKVEEESQRVIWGRRAWQGTYREKKGKIRDDKTIC